MASSCRSAAAAAPISTWRSWRWRARPSKTSPLGPRMSTMKRARSVQVRASSPSASTCSSRPLTTDDRRRTRADASARSHSKSSSMSTCTASSSASGANASLSGDGGGARFASSRGSSWADASSDVRDPPRTSSADVDRARKRSPKLRVREGRFGSASAASSAFFRRCSASAASCSRTFLRPRCDTKAASAAPASVPDIWPSRTRCSTMARATGSKTSPVPRPSTSRSTSSGCRLSRNAIAPKTEMLGRCARPNLGPSTQSSSKSSSRP
mmetsp:Transcript_7746/g.26490  ORF Transcript_7746/g.26490 Transcript_7746/m.26490 type:complete len:269 (-) Transcript_7746:172-978(-)